MPRQRKPDSYGAGIPARPDQAMATAAIRDTPGQQAIQVPPGQPYGQGVQLANAQRAVPLPQAPGLPAAPGDQHAQALALLSQHPPPAVNPLSGPSMRPQEPSTAGLSTGEGPGPEVLAGRGAPMKASQYFRSMYEQTGNEDYARYAESALARGQ